MDSSMSFHTAYVHARLMERERIRDSERRSASARANGSTISASTTRSFLARLGGRLGSKEDDS